MTAPYRLILLRHGFGTGGVYLDPATAAASIADVRAQGHLPPVSELATPV